MNPLVLDILSIGKERVTGRIVHVQRIDAERVMVQLDDSTRIHMFVATSNDRGNEQVDSMMLESATFVGTRKLGILEADVVVIKKRELVC